MLLGFCIMQYNTAASSTGGFAQHFGHNFMDIFLNAFLENIHTFNIYI